MNENQKNSNDEHQHGPFVTIIINNVNYQIHRGNTSVAEIKTLGGIALADDLNLLENNQLKPLSDDGHVTIKGGETFVSHPKGSQSS